MEEMIKISAVENKDEPQIFQENEYIIVNAKK